MFKRFNNMFAGNASYSLRQEPGSSDIDDSDNDAKADDDDEWVLVDFVADSCTTCSDDGDDDGVDAASFEDIFSDLECPSFTKDVECFRRLLYQPKDILPSLEESWFVTPPACFTAGELTTKEVETSPMENLLIEHPSMSVYAIHKLWHKGKARESEFQLSVNSTVDSSNQKTTPRIPCPVAAFKARMKSLEQTKNYRCTKFSKRNFDKRLINRNHIRRQNLAQRSYSCQTKDRALPVHQPCQRRYFCNRGSAKYSTYGLSWKPTAKSNKYLTVQIIQY